MENSYTINNFEIRENNFWTSLKYIHSHSYIFMLVISLCLLISVTINSKYGFDLTDEGFYLLWYTDPFVYSWSTTQFGYIYHYFFSGLGHSIFLLRVASYCLNWILSSILVYMSISGTLDGDLTHKFSSMKLLSIAFSVGSASCLLVAFELPQSPSYNALLYQSLLIGSIGLLLTTNQRGWLIKFGYGLVGVSWWLAFMAKAPSAAAFGLATVLYVFFAGRNKRSGLAVATLVSVFCLCASAMLIDGSIVGFCRRILNGIHLSSFLASGHSASAMLRWEPFPISGKPLLLLLAVGVCLAATMLCSRMESVAFRFIGIAGPLLLMAATITILIIGYPFSSRLQRYDDLVTLSVLLGCLIAALATGRLLSMNRRQIALFMLFLVLPHLYAFGTNRPYWLNAQGACLFWFLAGIVLVCVTTAQGAVSRVLTPVVAAILFFNAFFMAMSREYPMRQSQPFRLSTELLDIGFGNLVVQEDVASYIMGLRLLANANGFQAGAPVIDMTGESPGAVYALSGIAPGAAWLPGGYPGSGAFAKAALGTVDCRELARAWLLIAPSLPDALPADTLKTVGIDVAKDYREVGSVQGAANLSPTRHHQYLLKPLRNAADATASCEFARR